MSQQQQFKPSGHVVDDHRYSFLFVLIMIQNKSFCKDKNLFTMFIKSTSASSSPVLLFKIINYMNSFPCKIKNMGTFKYCSKRFWPLFRYHYYKKWSCWFKVIKSGKIMSLIEYSEYALHTLASLHTGAHIFEILNGIS